MTKSKWALICYLITLAIFVLITWQYGLRAALVSFVACAFMAGSTVMLKEIELERDSDDVDQNK